MISAVHGSRNSLMYGCDYMTGAVNALCNCVRRTCDLMISAMAYRCNSIKCDWDCMASIVTDLCNSLKREPRGTNWVTMLRLGGWVQAPMKRTTLGCFRRFMMLTSALNSCIPQEYI